MGCRENRYGPVVNGFSGSALRMVNSMLKCRSIASVNMMIAGMKSIDVVCKGMKNDRSTPIMMAAIDKKLKVFSNFIGAEVLIVFFALGCLIISGVSNGRSRSHIMKI